MTDPVTSDTLLERLRPLIGNLPADISRLVIELDAGMPALMEVTTLVRSPHLEVPLKMTERYFLHPVWKQEL